MDARWPDALAFATVVFQGATRNQLRRALRQVLPAIPATIPEGEQGWMILVGVAKHLGWQDEQAMMDDVAQIARRELDDASIRMLELAGGPQCQANLGAAFRQAVRQRYHYGIQRR